MAQSKIKNEARDLANYFSFNSLITTIMYKKVYLIKKMLFINIEAFISLSGVSANSWVDIGNVTLPSDVTVHAGQLIDFIVTSGGYDRKGNATFRINNGKLQIWLTNLEGNYLFINGFMTIN